jgi:hypothetical protein
LIFLSVCRNLTHKLVLEHVEVIFAILLICELHILRVVLPPSQVIQLVGLIKEARCEILCVEDPHLFFIHQHKKNALSEEETRVDRVVTDVEPIILKLRSAVWIVKPRTLLEVGIER